MSGKDWKALAQLGMFISMPIVVLTVFLGGWFSIASLVWVILLVAVECFAGTEWVS